MKCKVLISLGGVASTRAGAFAEEALRSCRALQMNCLVGGSQQVACRSAEALGEAGAGEWGWGGL